MTFWGLRVVSGKSYRQIILTDFHITCVALDPQSVTSKEIVSLQVEINGESYILCNLSLDHNIGQVHLKYQFYRGTEVIFSIQSESERASVSLTGSTVKPFPFTEYDKKIDSANPFKVLIQKGEVLRRSSTRVSEEDSSFKNGKENEGQLNLVKQKVSKSKDQTLPQESKNNNKLKSKDKINITDIQNSFEEDDEDDEEYVPEEEKESEEEMEDEEDIEGEEEEEEDSDDNENISIQEEEEEAIEEEEEEEDAIQVEKIEENSKENQDTDEGFRFLSKKKRSLSLSSPGRTPMPKASKKQKMQDLSGSPILPDNSSKKKKNKKKIDLESSVIDDNVSRNKTPKEKKKEFNSSDEKLDSLQSSLSKSKKRTGMGGIVIEDLAIGTGATVSNGKKAAVYYEGKLKNGIVFDKKKSGSFFKFKVGNDDVIKAWDIGILGMRVGGKRRIVAPPAMAYGKSGFPPDIPPNSVLTFDIELKGVN